MDSVVKGRVIAFQTWLEEEKGLVRGTLRAYGRVMSSILNKGGSPYDYLRGDYSPSYRGVIAAALKLWAEYTQDQDLDEALRGAKTKRLVRKPQSNPKTATTALSGTELEAFLDALSDRSVPVWAIPCLGLMAKLGLRSNDMLRLSKTDLTKSLDSDRLRVVGKGEKVRWLPTSPVTEEIELLLEIDDPPNWRFVWDIVAPGSRDEDNRPEYAYTLIWQEVRNVAEIAGIEHMTTHRLRKAAARKLYEASGHNLALVTKVLGHADPKTTLLYLEIDEDEFISQVGDLLKG